MTQRWLQGCACCRERALPGRCAELTIGPCLFGKWARRALALEQVAWGDVVKVVATEAAAGLIMGGCARGAQRLRLCIARAPPLIHGPRSQCAPHSGGTRS